MPNVNAVLNEQIRRLARREIKSNTATMKKATSHYRRDIASLKRQVSQLLKEISGLRKRMPEQLPAAPAEAVQKARLRVDGLKTHRARLGLSAKDYGQLLGVSALTVYHWEAGKSKPRRSQLPRILAVRGIGKREALERLGINTKPGDGTSSGDGRSRGRRARYARTAEEMILSLVKAKPLSTAAINEAWKKEGRSGRADVLLGKLVKTRKLKRKKVEGVRGSSYGLA